MPDMKLIRKQTVLDSAVNIILGFNNAARFKKFPLIYIKYRTFSTKSKYGKLIVSLEKVK